MLSAGWRSMPAPGTILPSRLPHGLIRKLGACCQWRARSVELPQWKGDRPSAMRWSSDADEPTRTSLAFAGAENRCRPCRSA